MAECLTHKLIATAVKFPTNDTVKISIAEIEHCAAVFVYDPVHAGFDHR